MLNDQLKQEQRDLLEEFENQKERLFQLKDQKMDQEQTLELAQQRLRKRKNEHFDAKQRIDELHTLHRTQMKEIQELKNKNDMIENDIKRKNQDLIETETYKDKVEGNIDALAADIARDREQKLVEQEYIRRTTNSNNLLQTKIEQLRKLIEDLVNQQMNTKKVTERKSSENDDLMDIINLLMKHITTLEEQNRELDNELDKFIATDNEIRTKLMDRERSPLRLGDLYYGKFDSKIKESQESQKYEGRNDYDINPFPLRQTDSKD